MSNVFLKLIELIEYRDEYYKTLNFIPDWNTNIMYYTIYSVNNTIVLGAHQREARILAFPTIEARNTFYNKYKYLIHLCLNLI